LGNEWDNVTTVCGELTAGACSSISVSTSGSIYSNSPTSWSRDVGPVVTSVEVPTLGESGLVALVALMLAAGLAAARRVSLPKH
jgi:hypothetical protein